MELDADERPVRDDRGEALAVLGAPEHVGGVVGDGDEAVHVVVDGPLAQAPKERRGPLPADLVPADLGQLQSAGGEFADLARDEAETLRATQLAGALEGE